MMSIYAKALSASIAVKSLEVKTLSSEMEGKIWDDFVLSRPESTSDHLWAWRSILSKTFGYQPHYLGAFERENLVGILPLFLIPRGLKSALSSIPFGNYGGLCVSSENIGEALLSAAKNLMAETKSLYLELRHQEPFQDASLQEKHLYSRFTRDIEDAPEIIFSGLGTKIRTLIKKSMKRGIEIHPSRDVEALYQIHLHTTRRQGTPCFPKRYFSNILETFGENAEIHFAMLDKKPIAYLFNLYFKNTVVCQFNGSLTEYLKLKPNNHLYWHQVEAGFARGAKLLDHGRSRKDSGAAEFKRLLQLQETPMTYQYYLPCGASLPSHSPSNPKYQAAIRIWQKLPLTVTRLAGPRLVRYLA